MADTQNSQTQMEGLATLLVLGDEIRNLNNIREFGFFGTNETHRLIPYHTAYLWHLKEFIGTHLVAQSGTAEIDRHAPQNQWVIRKINQIRSSAIAKDIHQIALDDVDLPDTLPEHMLWCPLMNKKNEVNGGLIFFSDDEFTPSQIKMLTWLIASYQYTWSILVKPKKVPSIAKFKEKPYLIGLCIAIFCLAIFPIRLSVLGEGTVAAEKPVFINAPIQGVIKSFEVNPGDTIKKGQLLFTMDKTDFAASVEVNNRDFMLTQAKLRAATNKSFQDKSVQADLPVIQAQLAIDKAKLEYSKELLGKTDVVSPINGIVVFESKEGWVGQPVRTGERILVVADPRQVELKISLPIANSMKLTVGDKGKFFLYGTLRSLPITLKTLGYNAKLMPNKILAYQLTADFNELDVDDIPQLGAQGTAKIYSHYVPLIYYILRRPLQALRQTLGI